MPFKSEAQKRKMGALVSEGKVSKETFNEWDEATKGDIPKRLNKTKKPRVRSVDDIRTIYKKRYQGEKPK